MEAVYAGTIVLAFIVLGELVSTWSKARIPSLLVAMLGIFVFAKIGVVPETVIDDSLLVQLYSFLVSPALFHMGSLIPLRVMLKQWRSVIIAVSGMLVAVLLILAIVAPIFGFETFVAGSGPLAGGIIAPSLTTDGLTAHGVAASVIVLPALVLMLQSLSSMPLTNFLLRRFAANLRDSGELHELAQAHREEEEEAAKKKKLVTLPDFLVDNQLFMLFLILVGGSAATLLAVPTHIPSSILALVLGILATAIGLSPDKAMERANSFGIAMAAVIAVVMAPLVTASLQQIIDAFLPTVTILIVGGAGILIGGFIATKLVRWKSGQGMSVALTAMYGFPADYLLTHEVARSLARDEDEKEALLNFMLPPMLVGGFTSVGAGSILIASVVCVLVVVFVHLLLVGVGRNPDGSPFIINPVSGERWFAPATWIAEIMPMIFVVGGFAAKVGWESAQRRGESASTFVRTRLRRLALPALPLFIVLTIALITVRAIGVEPSLAGAIAVPVGSVLWFLAAYALVQALAPWMIRWHERNPWLALVVLFAGAFFVDVVRLVVGIQGLGLDRIPADGYGIGDELFGLPNVAFVWLFAQQIGFCLRDGWFTRVRWWNMVFIAAGFASLALLVMLGEYSASMLTNQWPPTLPLAVLAAIQAALLTLLHRPLTAIMGTKPAQAVVFFLGSRLMSVYLWHVPAIVLLTGVQLLWLPMPDPGTGAWWLTRPVFVIAVLLIVWAISTVTKRWESPKPILSPRWPSDTITVIAVAVFVFQSLAISSYGLDLPLAILGLVCTTLAVVLTGPTGTDHRVPVTASAAKEMPPSPR
jgi:hypothetical protein